MCIHMCGHIPKYINTTFSVCVMLLICNIMYGFRTDDLIFSSNWYAFFFWGGGGDYFFCSQFVLRVGLRSPGRFSHAMRCLLFVVVQIMFKQLEGVTSRIVERKIIKARETGNLHRDCLS